MEKEVSFTTFEEFKSYLKEKGLCESEIRCIPILDEVKETIEKEGSFTVVEKEG